MPEGSTGWKFFVAGHQFFGVLDIWDQEYGKIFQMNPTGIVQISFVQNFIAKL